MWETITTVASSITLVFLNFYFAVETFKKNPDRIFRVGTPMEVSSPTGTWSTLPDIPTKRYEFAAETVNDQIYLIGGLYLPSVYTVTPDVDVYDVASKTWRKGTPLPQPLHHPSVVTLGGKIYVVGGNTFYTYASNTVYVYDPSVDSWTRKKDMPVKRGALGLVAIEDKIYAFGGSIHQKAYREAYVYDPQADTWEPIPYLPEPREHLTSTAVDGVAYAIGGLVVHASNPSNTLYAYTPSDAEWKKRANIPISISGLDAVAHGGYIYLFGGQQNFSVTNHVYVYDPKKNTWRRVADMPAPRYGGAAAYASDGIHFFGGLDTVYGTNFSTSHFLFVP